MNQKIKYLVVVDDKYLVSVESTSHGGAEHVVLDNIPEVRSALAFNLQENTRAYAYLVKNSETIAFEELKAIKEKERETMSDYRHLRAELNQYKLEVLAKEEELKEARDKRHMAFEALRIFKATHGLKDID